MLIFEVRDSYQSRCTAGNPQGTKGNGYFTEKLGGVAVIIDSVDEGQGGCGSLSCGVGLQAS